jgi:streptogramin lyase
VGRGPARLAAASGSIWLTHPAKGVVTRIDPSTGRTVAVIATGRSPHGMAADARGVWVALNSEALVVRAQDIRPAAD